MDFDVQETTHIVHLVSCERCGKIARDRKGFPAQLRIDSKVNGHISLEIPDGFGVQYSTRHERWYTIFCEDCLEKPCSDCGGGKFQRYCHVCKAWLDKGLICLECDSETTKCPTCDGKNFVRGKVNLAEVGIQHLQQISDKILEAQSLVDQKFIIKYAEALRAGLQKALDVIAIQKVPIDGDGVDES